MRADSHYVDQLESRYRGPAITLIPTRQIEAIDPLPAGRLEGLVESIAAHGILQPLLVRRHNGRYKLIAGRKRLAAAPLAGVTDVPCLIHDVDEEEATALARADNLTVPLSSNQTHPSADADCLRRALRALSVELAGVGSTAALLRSTVSSMFQYRVGADLIQAQAWRAAWLSGAAAVAAGHPCESAAKPIGSIFDRVRTGVEAEARLARLQIDWSVAPEAACCTLDDDLGAIAVTGCLFATLSWMEGLEEPHVEVRADAPNPRTLRIEVVQRMIPVSAEIARSALGLLTVKSLAAQHGGTVEFTVIGSRGSVIRSTFCKPNAN